MNFPASVLYETVKDLMGKNVKQEKDTDLTVREAIRFALTTDFERQEKPDGEKKFKEYRLAMRILDIPHTGNFELSAEEISLIKNKLIYVATEVMGYLYMLLEAPTQNGKANTELANELTASYNNDKG